MSNITVGSDPEVMMMINDRRPGRYCGMLPAKFVLAQLEVVSNMINDKIIKDGRVKSPAMNTQYGKVFADGASWEINPLPGTPEEVTNNITGLLGYTKKAIDLCKTDYIDLELAITPSVPLDISMLDKWDDPDLTEFGCDPDKSIHPRIINPAKIDAAKHPWRYCGAHIHFGLDRFLDDINFIGHPSEFFMNWENLYTFNIICDATIGCLGILFDDIVKDSAAQRRKVYGQPGVFRPQNWGIEYRTCSNSWLLSPRRSQIMLELATHIPQMFMNMDVVENTDLWAGDIRRALIEGDVFLAKEILLNTTTFYDPAHDTALNGCELLNIDPLTWKTEWLDDNN